MMFKDYLDKKIAKSIEINFQTGKFVRPGTKLFCDDCGQQLEMIQAVCWGFAVNNAEMARPCSNCQKLQETLQQAMVSFVSQPKKMFVVLMPKNLTVIISEVDLNYYITSMNAGAKAVVINDTVFDRVYPIISLDEWNKQKAGE